MNTLALSKLHNTVSVNGVGELSVNAGRYSRAAIVMAFELNGGIEKFAEWAQENPSEFYTKLFGKLIGREAEPSKTEEVEDLLNILDGEYEDVTDLPSTHAPTPASAADSLQGIFEPSERELRLVKAASAYADGEPLD